MRNGRKIANHVYMNELFFWNFIWRDGALNSYNIFKSLFTRMKDNNMSDFSINEMQEMQKAGKMRTEKQKTGIVWDSHRRTKVKNRKLRGKILSL